MGQKIHPYGLRLGIVTDWKSRWYSDKDYASQVAEDYHIRKYLRDELKRGAVSRIDIERIGSSKVQIDIHTGRPGVVIGRGGSEAERLRSGLEDLSGRRVKFNVIEVHNPELDATLLARSVADQLEGRVSFRRALKRTVATALKAGAEGVRVQASGRLGGADMGRREWYLEGRVPLHTLRADIDFGQATAETSVGAVGIKVWVYKGDIMKKFTTADKAAAEARLASGRSPDRKHRKSVKSRAEAAAGGTETRIIEAGGGKRLIEAGGGKRLIEAGGGKKVSAADAQADLAEAREAATPTDDKQTTDDKRLTTDDEPTTDDTPTTDHTRQTTDDEETATEVIVDEAVEVVEEPKAKTVKAKKTPKADHSDNADDASASAEVAASDETAEGGES